MAGIYVFILVFTVFPAAQQTNVPAETLRMIDELTLPNSTCGDMGAEPGEGPVELARASRA